MRYLLTGLLLMGMATVVRAEKIIGSFNVTTGECECSCTPEPCDTNLGAEVHAIAICRAACAGCSAGCPRPLVEHCDVVKDPRWADPVIKCRSVFSLPR